MRAVWSLWTKPFQHCEGSVWHSQYHAMLSWALSVALARRHYTETHLVTDDRGAALLVDELRLPFTHVSRELNRLDDHDADWWALGKLYSYRLQTEPFVHIDGDVFLWKPLPAELQQSVVFAQSPETFDPDAKHTYYPARAVEQTIPWLPRVWREYTTGTGTRTASCCGILGGVDTHLIASYADLGIRIAECRRNRSSWATWGNKGGCNVLIEQMLLDAVTTAGGHQVQHLFPGEGDPYDSRQATAAGYTHLIGAAKRHPQVLADLESRVRAEFPALAARCEAATQRSLSRLVS